MTAGGILDRASPEALVRAVEENLFAFGRLFGRWEKAETYNGPDMMWCLTDVPFPLFNSVVALRLDEEAAHAAIEDLKERARARGVPLLAWTGPSARPANIGRRLSEAGFVADGREPGMTLELDRIDPPAPIPAGLTIEPAEDGTTLRAWNHVMLEGFGMPRFVEEPLLELSAAMIGAPEAPVHNLLGRLYGVPVATATVLLGAGVAGIYNITTLRPARRRGIGRALTQACVAQARDAGYRYAILHASEQGAPLYRQMGFREVCTLATYVWSGDAEP